MKKRELRGRIILFQEERIRLIDERGQSFLLDISHKLPVTSSDLTGWIEGGVPVVVSYSGEAETETGTVESIKAAA